MRNRRAAQGPGVRSPQLSPLAQIEWTVADLEAPQRVLADLFGAAPIEEEFSAALAGPHMEIVHVGLGRVVLQLCRPLIDATGHWRALQRHGPHVYNLTWFVDDLASLLARCKAAGLALEWHFPLGELYDRVIARENQRGSLEAAMVEAHTVLGFNLELAETPWAREPEPRLVYPAYHPDWPERGERVGPLELINVVVPDVAAALELLLAVFGDALETRMSVTRNDAQSTLEAVVEIGRARLHYLQPEPGAAHHESAGQPEARVHSLALPLIDAAGVERSAVASGVAIEDCPAHLFEPGSPSADGARRLCTSGLLGIDLVAR